MSSKKVSVKVVVIGKGRFGNAVAQGLRESVIKLDDGTLAPVNTVAHFSARTFTSLTTARMADKLQGAAYIAYCGTQLQNYAEKIAAAMKYSPDTGRAEFIDFSNPCPVNETDDVGGSIYMWNALRGPKSSVGNNWKVWKITEVGSLDMADAEFCMTEAIVYGNGIARGEVPKLTMPGLVWKPATGSKSDLVGEAHERMMQRAEIDRWYDAAIMGFVMFLFCSTYAIVRYHEKLNGKEPTSNIPMYLLDKGYCWVALWMMVVSPMAGNVLALQALFDKFWDLNFLYKLVTLFCAVLMITPLFFMSLTYMLWIICRNMFFVWTRGTSTRLYEAQPSQGTGSKTSQFFKATLVDCVSMKGETGNVGFVYCLIHSFIGCIVADEAYKGYWFEDTPQNPNPRPGRMGWRFELSMMTGCVSTAVLWCVCMRSLFGSASWIRLKPLYSYMSPFGIWLATVHVMAFGAKGWNKLFNRQYHRGQMSITFVSSMLPTCVLLVHHIFAIFGTKKEISDIHLWKHSLNNIATQDFVRLTQQLDVSAGGYSNATVSHNSGGVDATGGTYMLDSSDHNKEATIYHMPNLTDEVRSECSI